MVLGFIMIGWIAGGLVATFHIALGGSLLMALALFTLSSSASILLTAALATLPMPRVLRHPMGPSAPPAPRNTRLREGLGLGEDGR